MESNCYVYVFLDNMKKGNYKYNKFNLSFDYQPYYVGISNSDSIHKRERVHIKYTKIGKDVCNNNYKKNIIRRILKNGQEPIYVRVFENLSLYEPRKLEKDLIKEIGNRYDNSGPLVNISSGGEGGDTFTNNPRKEEIREKHRQNAIGEKNNMYGRPLEENPSHLAKLSGKHWNKGRSASNELKEKLSDMRKGSGNSRAKSTLLFDGSLNLLDEFDCCKYLAESINSSVKSCQLTAKRNSDKDFPYHTTKEFIIIYKEDWENKFSNRIDEIRNFLSNHKKNKNQFSKK